MKKITPEQDTEIVDALCACVETLSTAHPQGDAAFVPEENPLATCPIGTSGDMLFLRHTQGKDARLWDIRIDTAKGTTSHRRGPVALHVARVTYQEAHSRIAPYRD